MNRAPMLPQLLNKMAAVYAYMDREYETAAAHYGFHCDGCQENCCRTRFHHHTVIEYLYLMAGVERLAEPHRTVAIQSARQVLQATEKALRENQPVREMCPLNENGLCLVYPWRPMICRLHGLPHELRGAHGKVLRGVGCAQFDLQTSGATDYHFDRTPIYQKMAMLEKEVRQVTGITQKIKMTIAEMLTTDRLL